MSAAVTLPDEAAGASATPADEPRPEERWWRELRERIAVEEAARAVHAQSCTERLCDDCERYACATCRTAQVNEREGHCVDCLVDEAVRHAGVPQRYADAHRHTRTRVRSDVARSRAAKALDARALIAEGPAGSGKSTLVCAMLGARARRLIGEGRRWHGAMFVSAIDLGRSRSVSRLGEEPEIVLDAMRAKVLVIDDLGAESPRDSEPIVQVIHARHDAEAPTWITTGITAEEIATRYGGGIARRIYEGAIVIDCAEEAAR